ncbi:hypothetical protein Vi05172_g144 [Venturia inaequalis]|nr:hypothetical protein Vi05172_g144 [Venturia inaequalis]
MANQPLPRSYQLKSASGRPSALAQRTGGILDDRYSESTVAASAARNAWFKADVDKTLDEIEAEAIEARKIFQGTTDKFSEEKLETQGLSAEAADALEMSVGHFFRLQESLSGRHAEEKEHQAEASGKHDRIMQEAKADYENLLQNAKAEHKMQLKLTTDECRQDLAQAEANHQDAMRKITSADNVGTKRMIFDLTELQATHDSLKEQQRIAEFELKGLRRYKAEKEAAFQTHDKALQDKTNECSELIRRGSELDKQVAAEKASVLEKSVALQAKDNECTGLKSESTGLKSGFTGLKSQLAKLEESFRQKSEALHAKDNECSKLIRQGSELDKQVAAEKATVLEKIVALQAKDNECTGLKSESTGLKSQLAKLEDSFRQKSEALSAKDNECSKLIRQSSELDKQVAAEKATVLEKSVALQAKDNECTGLNSQLAKLEDSFRRGSEALQAKDNECSELIRQGSELNKQVAAEKASVLEKSVALQAKDSESTGLKSQLAKLEDSFRRGSEALQAKDKECSELIRQGSKLDKQVAAEHRKLETEILALRKLKAEVEGLRKLKTEVETLRKLETEHSRLAGLVGQLQPMAAELDVLKPELELKQSSIDALSKEVADLKRKSKKAKADRVLKERYQGQLSHAFKLFDDLNEPFFTVLEVPKPADNTGLPEWAAAAVKALQDLDGHLEDGANRIEQAAQVAVKASKAVKTALDAANVSANAAQVKEETIGKLVLQIENMNLEMAKDYEVAEVNLVKRLKDKDDLIASMHRCVVNFAGRLGVDPPPLIDQLMR